MKKRISLKSIFTLIILPVIFFFQNGEKAFAQTNSFSCEGAVYTEHINLWNNYLKSYLQQQITDRLINKSDVYALYDIQIYLQSTLEMARRCKKTTLIREIRSLLEISFNKLEAFSSKDKSPAWICRGGNICNNTNKLLNSEVLLCSVQFLGLLAAEAQALASLNEPLTGDDIKFINKSVEIIFSHLKRWESQGEISSQKILALIPIKKQMVSEKSGSQYFYSDKALWATTIYAELAGLLQNPLFFNQHKNNLTIVAKKHFNLLIKLFLSRHSVEILNNKKVSDIDAGYWRFYTDNRYANYASSMKPVSCTKDKNGQWIKTVNVAKESVPLDQNAGWDISHARRLVPFFDSLTNNKNFLQTVFNNLTVGDINSISETQESFQNKLSEVIWNQNEAYPLFSNFWNGKNGWYRVAYDNGTQQCVEGFSPSGLSFSVPTGGFLSWNQNQQIKKIGQNLYNLSLSLDKTDIDFVNQNYSQISSSSNSIVNKINRFMFLASVISN